MLGMLLVTLFIKLYSYLDKPDLYLADHNAQRADTLTYYTCMPCTQFPCPQACMHACCLCKLLNALWLSKLTHHRPALGKQGPNVDGSTLSFKLNRKRKQCKCFPTQSPQILNSALPVGWYMHA